jgi:NADPH2:quinone reductase
VAPSKQPSQEKVNVMSENGTMRAWRVHEYGQPLDVLQLDTVPIPEPGPNEVRVKNLGIPLNLNDIERINGGNMMVIPPLPCIPGMEVMGIVDAVGPGAEQWLGKRVVSTTNGATGGYAEYTLCGTSSMFEMPDDIPMPDAAALFFPFHLAWLGLFERAELQAGETVLIHAAAGGAGSAAVQLAVNAGAKVFATAGSKEKVELCRELGAQVAINYREENFAEIVMAETDNRGVDVVFDNVGPGVFEDSLKVTAYNGRYVLMGFAGDKTKADEPWIIPRKMMAGNLKLTGVLMSYAAPEAATFVKQMMGFNFLPTSLGQQINDSIIELVRSKAVHPVIGRVATFDELPQAIHDMGQRGTTGRVIIQP